MFVDLKDRLELRRTAAACLALFQLGSTATLTYADALLDAASTGSADHIESPDNTGCAAHHGHLICQVVRSLSQAGVPRGVTMEDGLAPPVRVVESNRDGDSARCPPILFGSVIPRGPPV